ncbi:MAG: AAA family ATPase [Lachnospiraceae bacterium]|nr:AAA family ATPase [Lachnospiraceae bacterium]
MGVYREKLFELAPVIHRRYEKKGSDVTCQVLKVEGWLKEYYDLEYLRVVPEFFEYGDGMLNNKRIFLITEEENVGLKAAFAIINYPLYGDMEGACNNTITRLQSMKEYSFLLTGGVPEREIMYFTGLAEEDKDFELGTKLRCIMSCQASLQFVQLKEEQLDMPWARELLMNKECEVIYLPKCSRTYYIEVMEKLLAGERYRLDASLNVEQLLFHLQKKCGNKFGEEDMAWSLDQAEKSARCRGDYRYFKTEDFRLDSYTGKSSMKTLDGMTGLSEVKQLAYEYAALEREQLRNEKLTDICKHVIFVGKPGTGKTMCGRLLAQIMSEQGQTNGSFVQATRKDIIGEYVGQTAPKVAGLFTKARKGVLFVDEAGFMLHETRDSFTQEAVKEFIRYMELYQDVMVIFALYPGEVDAFLKLDVGLSSRISRVVPFEDYSEQELLAITRGMCEAKGYQLAENCEEMICSYMKEQRRKLGNEFGNAREGRKLVETAVIARSIRCFEEENPEEIPSLTPEDFSYGIRRLYRESGRKAATIGFVTGGV